MIVAKTSYVVNIQPPTKKKTDVLTGESLNCSGSPSTEGKKSACLLLFSRFPETADKISTKGLREFLGKAPAQRSGKPTEGTNEWIRQLWEGLRHREEEMEMRRNLRGEVYERVYGGVEGTGATCRTEPEHLCPWWCQVMVQVTALFTNPTKLVVRKFSGICGKRLMLIKRSCWKRRSSISNANVDAFTSWPRRQRQRGKVQKLCELRRILESGVGTPSGTSSQWLLYLVNSKVWVLSPLSSFSRRKTKTNPPQITSGGFGLARSSYLLFTHSKSWDDKGVSSFSLLIL